VPLFINYYLGVFAPLREEILFRIRIISRKDAKAQGLTHYFTGVACKRGHISLRLVSCLQCCDCQKERMKWYRPIHKDRYLALDRKQKAKDRDKLRERDKRRYWADPRKAVARVQAYYATKSETLKAKRRERHAESATRNDAEYAEILRAGRERVRQWCLDNPEKALRLAKVQSSRRRARQRNSSGSFSADDVRAILKLQRNKCAYCRCALGLNYHLDHVIPLSKGGANDRRNLQILCKPCNLEKGARDPMKYARLRGKLL